MAWDFSTVLQMLAAPAEEILPALGVASISEITQIVTLAQSLVNLGAIALKDRANATADAIQVGVAGAETGAKVLEDEKFPTWR